jgi:hypothetical protein
LAKGVDPNVIFLIVVLALSVLGPVVRKILEKVAQPGRGAPPGPGRGAPPGEKGGGGLAKEIRDFLEELNRQGAEPPREAEQAPPPVVAPPPPPERERPAPVFERPPLGEPLLRPERKLDEGLAASIAPPSRKVPRVLRPQGEGRAVPVPIALSGEGIDRDRLREFIVWTEILNRPRAHRSWRPRER